MPDTEPVRPPQVTLAGWLVVGGSVLVVLLSFGQVGQVRSLETRESIEEYLSETGLGLSVTDAQTLLRIALMVAAATAAACAILGWQVLQRSRAARLALSLLALPLFVTGLASGGFAAAVVAAAIVMLWFQPARDWFDGITRPAPQPPPPLGPDLPVSPPAPDARDPLLDLPPPTQPPLHPTPYAVRSAPAVARTRTRPAAVTWACLLTWGFSAFAAALFAATLVVLSADPQQLLDEMHRQNPELADQFTDSATRAVLYTVSGVFVAWSLVAAGLAVLVWRRVAWAAVALMVSAGLAAALCLVMVVGSVAVVVPLAACAAALAMLLRPESRAWFRGR